MVTPKHLKALEAIPKTVKMARKIPPEGLKESKFQTLFEEAEKLKPAGKSKEELEKYKEIYKYLDSNLNDVDSSDLVGNGEILSVIDRLIELKELKLANRMCNSVLFILSYFCPLLKQKANICKKLGEYKRALFYYSRVCEISEYPEEEIPEIIKDIVEVVDLLTQEEHTHYQKAKDSTLLRLLNKEGPLTQEEIQNKLVCSRSTVYRDLTRCIKKGTVKEEGIKKRDTEGRGRKGLVRYYFDINHPEVKELVPFWKLIDYSSSGNL